jgi:hypothetical protein
LENNDELTLIITHPWRMMMTMAVAAAELTLDDAEMIFIST